MLLTDLQLRHLPNPEELPSSDDTPVDNEEQNLLPNLLLATLYRIWLDRQDWFFGVDMALYHTTGKDPRIPIVPDAFLSLGVERKKGGKFRRSYVVWAEGEVVPILTLEMVSHKPGGEYTQKLETYRKLGVLYYGIYNPEFNQRDRHAPFEFYRLHRDPLHGDQYVLQTDEPYWMPEIGLGLGRYDRGYMGMESEILTWFDGEGNPYEPPEVSQSELERERRRADREQQRAEAERQRAEQERSQAQAAQQQAEAERQRAEETAAQAQQSLAEERQRAQNLADYLRSLGIDPDNLPNPGDRPTP
jgi:Uma2 family endonuclease